MLAQVHFPQSISGEALDRYLADGWFRMGQSIFTTNFLNFKNQFYSAVWLRLVLNKCDLEKSSSKILKICSRFEVDIASAVIDREKEQLYSAYRQKVSFEPSTSVQSLLFGKATHNVYDTMEVTVRDHGKLIGCGFFDVGKRSTAGISSFYDPDYRKFSLGKFLILQKVAYSQLNSFDYFYPGYFVPGYRPFDYKLTLHPEAQEFLDLASNSWKPIEEFDPKQSPFEIMKMKLMELSTKLHDDGVESVVLQYDYYDANLVPDLSHMELFDFPVFLQYFDFFDDAINSLVVYDVRDQQYHWLVVKSVWKSDQAPQSVNAYNAHLLKVEEAVFSTASVSEISFILSQAIRMQLLRPKN